MVNTSPSNAGGTDWIPSWGAKITHAMLPEKSECKTEAICNKFNKNFKNGSHQKKKFLEINFKQTRSRVRHNDWFHCFYL